MLRYVVSGILGRPQRRPIFFACDPSWFVVMRGPERLGCAPRTAFPAENPSPMATKGHADVADVIERVLERSHEGNRRKLPLIVDLARAYEWRGGSAGIGDRFQALADALEAHMLRKEMRLFPMMLQGRGTTIESLIGDFREEHGEQRAALIRLQLCLEREDPPPSAEAQLAALRAAMRKLCEDLAQHMQIEEERLFRPFETPVR